ncbi:MAG: hypothetical protein QM755_19000 [Luteolibacter sp.]
MAALFAPEGASDGSRWQSREATPPPVNARDNIRIPAGMKESRVRMKNDRITRLLRPPPAYLRHANFSLDPVRWGRRLGSSATGYPLMPLRGKENIGSQDARPIVLISSAPAK